MRNCNELHGLHLAVFAVCSSEDMGKLQQLQTARTAFIKKEEL